MFHNTAPARNLRDTVDEIVDRWRAGDPPNALSVFAEMPEVMQHHSLAIDLAYEEYCLRKEAGEEVDPKQFCRQFSSLRHSLGRMLQVHGLLKSTSLGLPAEKSIDWPTPGKSWLQWNLIEEIGRGAFSRVFIAEEPELGHRRVVLKCSQSGPVEAFVQGKFAHPNLMPVHSIASDKERDLVGICMPLVGRVTFAQVLDRVANSNPEAVSPQVFSPEYGGWPENVPETSCSERKKYALTVARKIEQVARGLAAVHEQKVLHGDIKPSNILLSFTGEPLLVDFNLSVAEAMPQQRMGGTPPYMAPERLPLLTLAGLKSTANSEPEYRSDVFSLGVVLFELLYGETPYELKLNDLAASYECGSKQDLALSRDVAGQTVPAELLAIVQRAIALDPSERFPTAAALADSLAKFRHDQTAQSRRIFRQRLVTLALLIVFGLFCWSLPILMRSEENWALRRAIQNIERGEYVEAESRLRFVQQKHDLPEINAWLGYCLAQLENFSLARKQFEGALPDHDESGVLWHNIGCCKLAENLPQAAIEDFDIALTKNPHLRRSYAQRAAARLRLSRLRKSELLPGTRDDLESALALGGDEAALSFLAAQVYARGVSDDEASSPMAKQWIRRSLELGIPIEQFAGPTFEGFDVKSLLPAPLPASAPPHRKADDFLPPTCKLQPILEQVR